MNFYSVYLTTFYIQEHEQLSMGQNNQIEMFGPQEPLRCSPHTPKGAQGEDGTTTNIEFRLRGYATQEPHP